METKMLFGLLLGVCILGLPNPVDGKKWLRFKNHWYHHSTQRLNWIGAQMFCRREGGNLVHIDNAQENNWLSAKYTTGSIWIGATDQVRESDWRSITTGKSVPYTNWSRGNPDNHRRLQHCATLNWGGRGRWDDNYCYRQLTFICEVSGFGY